MKERKFNQQSVKSAERKETTVRGGGLKKAFYTQPIVVCCLMCLLSQSVNSQKWGYFWSSLGLDGSGARTV